MKQLLNKINNKIMKTKIILIMLISFFSISLANATEPTIMVKKVLTEKVTYPEKAKDLMIEGTVTVTFAIDNAGKIIVKEAKSESDVLKEGVVDQLKNFTMEPDPAYKDNTYSIKFTFELIK
jgi:TonB family protein